MLTWFNRFGVGDDVASVTVLTCRRYSAFFHFWEDFGQLFASFLNFGFFAYDSDFQSVHRLFFNCCIDFTKRVCYNNIVKILSLICILHVLQNERKVFCAVQVSLFAESASLFFIPIRLGRCTLDSVFLWLPSSTEHKSNRKYPTEYNGFSVLPDTSLNDR